LAQGDLSEYEQALREQLPQSILISCATDQDWETSVFPEEEALIEHSIGKRQREFRAGRHCAHRVLNQLNHKNFVVLRGDKRAPIWPQGITGSISHSGAVCAAAASMDPNIVSLGIDIEEHIPLKEKLTPKICTSSEVDQIRVLNKLAKAYAWEKIIFSVKESVYKAWFPVFGSYLDFLEVKLLFDERGLVSATNIQPKASPPNFENYLFTSDYRIVNGYILASTLCTRQPKVDIAVHQQTQQSQQ